MRSMLAMLLLLAATSATSAPLGPGAVAAVKQAVTSEPPPTSAGPRCRPRQISPAADPAGSSGAAPGMTKAAPGVTLTCMRTTSLPGVPSRPASARA